MPVTGEEFADLVKRRLDELAASPPSRTGMDSGLLSQYGPKNPFTTPFNPDAVINSTAPSHVRGVLGSSIDHPLAPVTAVEAPDKFDGKLQEDPIVVVDGTALDRLKARWSKPEAISQFAQGVLKGFGDGFMDSMGMIKMAALGALKLGKWGFFAGTMEGQNLRRGLSLFGYDPLEADMKAMMALLENIYGNAQYVYENRFALAASLATKLHDTKRAGNCPRSTDCVSECARRGVSYSGA